MPDYVTPRVNGRKVTCECGGRMKPETGWLIEEDNSGAQWIWWRCAVNAQHISCAVPDPKTL